jgi:hypothetical protein
MGQLADDLQRRLRPVRLVAAHHRHVTADLVGQRLLGHRALLAQRRQLFAEAHRPPIQRKQH